MFNVTFGKIFEFHANSPLNNDDDNSRDNSNDDDDDDDDMIVCSVCRSRLDHRTQLRRRFRKQRQSQKQINSPSDET